MDVLMFYVYHWVAAQTSFMIVWVADVQMVSVLQEYATEEQILLCIFFFVGKMTQYKGYP
jgi:hypothetical protein